MKIVHLCLCSAYPDNYSYQENLLPKFHKELGHEVEIIASQQSFDEHGRVCFLDRTGSYRNEHDIRVTRLPYKRNDSMGHKLKRYIGTREALESAKPDILFIHGGQFMDASIVADYLKRHPNVRAYVDNHADYTNGCSGWVSKNLLHGVLWKHEERRLEPYVRKFYGVLPVRKDFLIDMYGLPREKCELLVMGADDEMVRACTAPEVREATRAQYGVGKDDILIVTGGKINHYRPETLHLMRAVIGMNDPRVKLLIFGNVADELKAEFEELLKHESIVFAGWQNAEGTYKLMAAAELVVFPGLHSVMWEQAVALGVPCVFRDIDGFHHVDLGGNAILLKDVSEASLSQTIGGLIRDPEKRSAMQTCAREKGMKVFSYRDIARRSIEE